MPRRRPPGGSSSRIRTPASAISRKPKSRGCEPCAAAGAGRWCWRLATILLCINQQFSLRFFIGYTQLNTEYFYLLIALMLPFTFLIFPNSEKSPLDRIPWYDILFFVLTFGSAIVLMRHVRKAA